MILVPNLSALIVNNANWCILILHMPSWGLARRSRQRPIASGVQAPGQCQVACLAEHVGCGVHKLQNDNQSAQPHCLSDASLILIVGFQDPVLAALPVDNPRRVVKWLERGT